MVWLLYAHLLQSEPAEIRDFLGEKGEARSGRSGTSKCHVLLKTEMSFVRAFCELKTDTLMAHLGHIQRAAAWEKAAPLRQVRCSGPGQRWKFPLLARVSKNKSSSLLGKTFRCHKTLFKLVCVGFSIKPVCGLSPACLQTMPAVVKV